MKGKANGRKEPRLKREIEALVKKTMVSVRYLISIECVYTGVQIHKGSSQSDIGYFLFVHASIFLDLGKAGIHCPFQNALVKMAANGFLKYCCPSAEFTPILLLSREFQEYPAIKDLI